jgi:hypothetical protein
MQVALPTFLFNLHLHLIVSRAQRLVLVALKPNQIALLAFKVTLCNQISAKQVVILDIIAIWVYAIFVKINV